MINKILIPKNLDKNLIYIFVIFCLLNQLKFINKSIEYLHDTYFVLLISFSIYLIYKVKINFKKIKFFLPLILVSILVLFDFAINHVYFDLRISIYLLLIIFFSYHINHFQNELFLKIIIYISIVFLIIGAFGWLNGGQNLDNLGIWGKQYVYFAYKYMPSTRNEDHQIFIYSFLFSTYYLFFIKWEKKILIINQLNLVALFLTFSRGAYVVTTINIIIFIIFIFFLHKRKRRKLFIYTIITTIFLFSSIQLINKTVNINLNSVFLVKLDSFNYTLNITSLKKKRPHEHLLKSSKNSLEIKVNEWNSLKEINKKTIFENFKNNNKRYYESSFLYLFNNFNIIVIILIFYFFLKNIIFNFNKFDYKNYTFFNILILINLTLLNLVYNYLDDIWNYLIIFYILNLVNKKFKVNYRYS